MYSNIGSVFARCKPIKGTETDTRIRPLTGTTEDPFLPASIRGYSRSGHRPKAQATNRGQDRNRRQYSLNKERFRPKKVIDQEGCSTPSRPPPCGISRFIKNGFRLSPIAIQSIQCDQELIRSQSESLCQQRQLQLLQHPELLQQPQEDRHYCNKSVYLFY